MVVLDHGNGITGKSNDPDFSAGRWERGNGDGGAGGSDTTPSINNGDLIPA